METSNRQAPKIEVVSRRHLGRNRLFEIFLDEVVDESGQRVNDYLSVIPTHTDPNGYTGIAILPINQDGRFGLIRVFRHPQGVSAWEIPKGFIESHENLRYAASRELFEETGLRVLQEELEELGYISPLPGVVLAKIRLFAGRVVSGKAADVSQEELGHGQIAFFSMEQILHLAKAGEIEEPCTLVAVYRYSYLTHSI